jgi:hypothetical protein
MARAALSSCSRVVPSTPDHTCSCKHASPQMPHGARRRQSPSLAVLQLSPTCTQPRICLWCLHMGATLLCSFADSIAGSPASQSIAPLAHSPKLSFSKLSAQHVAQYRVHARVQTIEAAEDLPERTADCGSWLWDRPFTSTSSTDVQESGRQARPQFRRCGRPARHTASGRQPLGAAKRTQTVACG